MKETFRAYYSEIVENIQTIKKWIKIIIIIVTIYYVILSYVNYDLAYFFEKELLFLVKILGVVLAGYIYHKLFGKWSVHLNNAELTRQYTKEKMPRSMKIVAPRGGGKDTTASGMVTVLRQALIEKIEEEMDEIKMICYPYDFDQLEKYLHENHQPFMTNVKRDAYVHFKTMIEDNDAFIKKYYQKDFSVEEHLEELNILKKDPTNESILKMKYVFNDGITKKHFLSMLLRYSLLFIRYHYLDSYVIANQPYKETNTKAAKVFSTNYVNIQRDSAEWPWPLVGGVIMVETETDAFHPNVGGTESPMKSGFRNFMAFLRHLLGEEAIYINIGQNSKRTAKSIRELDDAFMKILDMTKVYGGEKRIFFLSKFIGWHNFFAKHSLLNRTKERHNRRRSINVQKVLRCKNEGFLYFDVKISRTDEFTQAKQMSLKQILRYDKPIFENYTTRICFRMHDSFGRFNTHYLEIIADMLAKQSKKQWQDVEEWDLDLQMKPRHIKIMKYGVLDQMTKQRKDTHKKGKDDGKKEE